MTFLEYCCERLIGPPRHGAAVADPSGTARAMRTTIRRLTPAHPGMAAKTGSSAGRAVGGATNMTC